jgi:cytochrome c-type biogenesis protein CcmH/NrfF
VALTATSVLLPALLSAQDGTQEEGPPAWAYALAHELMSPFCPGRTLAACPSPQAGELRQWIVFQALAGRTRDDIERSLYDRYGDVLLSSPRAEGWGLSAYAVPIGAFLVGGGLVAWLLRRLVGRSTSGVANSLDRSSDLPRLPGEMSLAQRGKSGRAGPLASDSELERLVDEELARS